MEIKGTDEKLDRYAKESRKIVYSTNIAESEYNPRIVLRELTNTDGHNIWGVVLKYNTLENLKQEVILGTIDPTKNRRENVLEIVSLLKKQLEENINSSDEYTYYLELNKYLRSNNIEFDFTMEGIDIISCKNKEEVAIRRTIFENERGRLQMIFSETEIEAMKKNKTNLLEKYLLKQQEEQRWQRTRERILKSKTEEEQQEFLKGEKIAKIMQDTEVTERDTKTTMTDKFNLKKKVISSYLLDAYDSDEGYDDRQSAKLALLNIYMKVKEEGLATQANETLDILETRVYKKIEQQRGEVAAKDSEEIRIFDNYKQFFNLVRSGLDWNARIFALKIGKIDFNLLKRIFERFDGEDKELQTYLEYKEKVVNETQIEKISSYEKGYDSIRQLYEFLLNSSTRDVVEKDEEYLVSKIFEQYTDEMFQKNAEAIQLYNSYAIKYDRYVCPIPEKYTKGIGVAEEEKGTR